MLGDERYAQNVERIRAEFETYRPLDLIDGFMAAGDADEPRAAGGASRANQPAG